MFDGFQEGPLIGCLCYRDTRVSRTAVRLNCFRNSSAGTSRVIAPIKHTRHGGVHPTYPIGGV